MFPLWDDVPAQRFPAVNTLLIISCVIVFLMQTLSPGDGEQIIREFGMVPVRVTDPDKKSAVLEGRDETGRWVRMELPLTSPVPAWVTLLTSMFLHGGWMHLIGNMWFLYIFGDNVEDRYGHARYLMMYLASGIAAAVLHILSTPASPIPTVGASGAIGGVMGAYLFLYPHARVMTLLFLGIFSRLVLIPAIFFLGFWFVIQIVSGLADHMGTGGVAWWAHVGGFGTGLGVTFLMQSAGLLNPVAYPSHLHGSPPHRQDRELWH